MMRRLLPLLLVAGLIGSVSGGPAYTAPLAALAPPFAFPTEGWLGACWNDPDPRIRTSTGSNHTGIDVWSDKDDDTGTNVGKPVYAVYDGELELIADANDARLQIKIDTLPAEYEGIVPQRSGLRAYYTHLAEKYVRPAPAGSPPVRVSKGQLIGRQGNKGTQAVHLHFSIKKGSLSELDIINTHDLTTYLGVNLAYPSCGINTKRWMERFERGATAPVARLDLAFVIDTTGSMWDDIATAKANSTEIVNSIQTSTDMRMAVVDFRDFPTLPFGWFGDYPYRDALAFTADRSRTIAAINGLSIGNGADWPESSYCALLHVIRGDRCAGWGADSTIGKWRASTTKVIIWITDAPPHEPEPFTGFTGTTVKNAAKDFVVIFAGSGDEVTTEAAVGTDPIIIYPVLIGGDPFARPILADIATSTGGKLFTAPTAADLVQAILDALGEATKPPADTIPPTVEILPGVAAGYTQGTPLRFAAADEGGSGLASSSATLDGAPVSSPVTLTRPGQHTYVVTATDNAGNTTTRSITFNVYGFEWRPPLGVRDLYTMQDGSTLPVKFSVLDARRNLVIDSSVLVSLYDNTGAQRLGPFVFGINNPNMFVDAQNKQYIHTLHANNMGLTPGRYEVRVTFDSASLIGRNAIMVEILNEGRAASPIASPIATPATASTSAPSSASLLMLGLMLGAVFLYNRRSPGSQV